MRRSQSDFDFASRSTSFVPSVSMSAPTISGAETSTRSQLLMYLRVREISAPNRFLLGGRAALVRVDENQQRDAALLVPARVQQL